jgi:tetratricopeptide (TPR) repeat protein
MMRTPLTQALLAFVACLAIAGWSLPAAAQIPDKFTNLKVLPKDISKDELVGIMRGFAGDLGVRCNHCHVGSASGDLREMHFAADDKKEKATARVMLAMVTEINGSLIPRAGIEKPLQVKCGTCHHGVNRPQSITDVTKTEFEKGGVDAATANYLALKEKYYGADAYNFKPEPLNAVAEWLSEDKKDNDAAIAIMQFNIEQNPGVAYCYNLLGRIQAGAGQKDAAIASLKKAIELDPEDKWSKGILEKLQTKK